MRSQEALFQSLQDQGWAVSDDAIPQSLQESLYRQSQTLWQAGHFHEAHIGRQESNVLRTDIRGDSICWLETEEPLTQNSDFFSWAADLRQELNQRFYLGLRSEEFHFARYPSGRGYKKHIDQHRSSQHRKISLVLYLNPQWATGDGGELCLYSPGNEEHELLRILPQPARLVIFRSDTIPHEVLPALQTRWSLTGWFRNDSELEMGLAA